MKIEIEIKKSEVESSSFVASCSNHSQINVYGHCAIGSTPTEALARLALQYDFSGSILEQKESPA